MTKGYAPDTLSDRHHLMAMMLASGWTNAAIATELGYSESRVSIVRHSPLMQALVAQVRRDIRERGVQGVADRLLGLSEKAVGVIEGVLDAPADQAKGLQAAFGVLDRNPATARVQKHEGDAGVHVTIAVTDRDRMRGVLAEVRRSTPHEGVGGNAPMASGASPASKAPHPPGAMRMGTGEPPTSPRRVPRCYPVEVLR